LFYNKTIIIFEKEPQKKEEKTNIYKEGGVEDQKQANNRIVLRISNFLNEVN